MSSSKTAILNIHSGGAFINIEVLDARYALIASENGQLNKTLPHGIYTIKFKAGKNRAEKTILLQSNTVIHADEIPELINNDSSIPLYSRTAQNEAMVDHAKAISLKGFRDDKMLFIHIWSASKYDEAVANYNAISVYSLDGQEVCEGSALFKEAVKQHEKGWSAALTFLLPKDTYRLRYKVLERSITKEYEQIIEVRNSMQTQIFLYAHEDHRIDLFNTSMAISNSAFDPKNPNENYPNIERARLGLTYGQSLLSEDSARKLIHSKYLNPTLGVYGAHLLIQHKKQSHYHLLNVVFRNLSTLLGPHPDCLAIGYWLKLNKKLNKENRPYIENQTITLPPMLQNSWDIIMEYSIKNPEVIAINSLAAKTAGNTYNTGAYLLWEPTEDIKAYNFRPSEATIETEILSTRTEKRRVSAKRKAPTGRGTMMNPNSAGMNPNSPGKLLSKNMGNRARKMKAPKAHKRKAPDHKITPVHKDKPKTTKQLFSIIFARIIESESIHALMRTNDFTHAELLVLKYIYKELPTEFLEVLHAYIVASESNQKVEKSEAQYIADMMVNMTDEVLGIIRTSIKHLKPENQKKLKHILSKFGKLDDKFSYFQAQLSDLSNVKQKSLLEQSKQMKQQLKDLNIANIISPKSYVHQMRMPEQSVNMALKGLVDKLK